MKNAIYALICAVATILATLYIGASLYGAIATTDPLANAVGGLLLVAVMFPIGNAVRKIIVGFVRGLRHVLQEVA